jgi:ATP-dependent DNA helicase RecQ
VLAQKALSAVFRSRQQLPMSVLVDVLKGTHSPAVQENGWDRIKTFGAGNDVSAFAWIMFIQQFLQLGLLEIAYADHYHLRITRSGETVLQGERPVRLVSPETIKERQERPKQRKDVLVAGPSSAAEDLLAELKALRRNIAADLKKPAYIVFSDASLLDMAEKRPSNIYEFRLVNGVGDHKASQFGKAFLDAIAKWRKAQG